MLNVILLPPSSQFSPRTFGPCGLYRGHDGVQPVDEVGMIAVVGVVGMRALGALVDHVLAVMQDPVDVVFANHATARIH